MRYKQIIKNYLNNDTTYLLCPLLFKSATLQFVNRMNKGYFYVLRSD